MCRDDPFANDLRSAVRKASRLAFQSVRDALPNETFYYYALVTTGDALRPGPSASSIEGLERVLAEYANKGSKCTAADLRWSEADSPYDMFGDEYFAEVERLWLNDSDYLDIDLPFEVYDAEVKRRFEAMEGALYDLDQEGFFGTGNDRKRVLINVVAPGEDDEDTLIQRAHRLNPPESVVQLEKDWQ